MIWIDLRARKAIAHEKRETREREIAERRRNCVFLVEAGLDLRATARVIPVDEEMEISLSLSLEALRRRAFFREKAAVYYSARAKRERERERDEPKRKDKTHRLAHGKLVLPDRVLRADFDRQRVLVRGGHLSFLSLSSWLLLLLPLLETERRKGKKKSNALSSLCLRLKRARSDA